jgi:uncharacterized protein
MQERIDEMSIQAPSTGLPVAEPMPAQERMEVLDIIRGFALLGILIANMALFSTPAMYLEVLGKNISTGFWDTTTTSFINLLIQGKFYTMFSFLFGLGFALFFERALGKSAKPKFLFYKRLFVLLLIGLVHGFFIWHGDILVTYALFGFLLPLFFFLKPKTLLKWAAALFIGFLLVMTLIMGLVTLAKTVNEGVIADTVQKTFADMQSRIESSYHAYGHGTFAEITAQRASDTLFVYANALFTSIFVIFPLFLLGLYAGKKNFFKDIADNLDRIKKAWLWGLVIGLSMSVVKFICKNMMAGDPHSFYTVFYLGAGFFGDMGLCLFIMTSILLLCQNEKWKLRFKPLAYAGRMALSNYLFQSIVCTAIFYSYGLGLYGRVGAALCLVLAIVIFIAQIFISQYWFKRYQFGPVEWLWKSLTYGKFFGMKIHENASR